MRTDTSIITPARDPKSLTPLECMLVVLLQYGSWCAFAIVAAGVGLCLVAQRPGAVNVAQFSHAGQMVVSAGVALFIALPILRLALMCAVFLRERDYRFFCIAALVLCILACGCLLGVKLGPVGG